MEAMVRRYLNLWAAFFANSLTRDMEYKANLIGGIIVDIIFYSVQYFFFSIIYSYVNTLGSFTREDVMVFLIITFISDTVYMFLFSGNLFPLNRLVVQGDLDFILLKPINSQFLVSFRFVKSYAIFSLIILILMLINQTSLHSIDIGPMNYLFFSISFFCGLIIWYSLDFLIACLTFWFKNFTVGSWLSHEILKFSARPDSIYIGFTRKLLFSLIPMALVSSVPARMLLYGLNLKLLMYQIAISLSFLLFTFWVWKRGLLRYESASS
tara:strand:- start:9 stop:809 length:801 start_codon:yes stop_codon:yes gene_type:complete